MYLCIFNNLDIKNPLKIILDIFIDFFDVIKECLHDVIYDIFVCLLFKRHFLYDFLKLNYLVNLMKPSTDILVAFV